MSYPDSQTIILTLRTKLSKTQNNVLGNMTETNSFNPIISFTSLHMYIDYLFLHLVGNHYQPVGLIFGSFCTQPKKIWDQF